jgi:hypothetical protein
MGYAAIESEATVVEVLIGARTEERYVISGPVESAGESESICPSAPMRV